MASVAALIHRRRKRKSRRRAARAKSRIWAIIIGSTLTLLVALPLAVLLGGAWFVYAQAVSGLPTPRETLALGPVIGPTRLYDAGGETLIYAVRDPLGGTRTWVTLDELPPAVADATLLMEDPDFLQANHFNPFDTLSKLWRNFLLGPVPPDPTLTGRLVHNVIDPQSEAGLVEARGREIALVAEINRLYSPQQILEWHLNTNYYGNEIYGIDAAAQLYLGKHAVELTLDEAALLAAIPLEPQYNPIDNEMAARGRQADMLRALLAKGFISQEQYLEVSNRVTPLRLDGGQTPSIAPEFALYARRQAEHILDTLGWDGARMVSRGGLRITTTLDVDLYLQSECTLRTHLAQLKGETPDGRTLTGELCTGAVFLPSSAGGGASPPDTGTLVILDVATGTVKSLVGLVTRDDNQPGPTLYPFVYFTGFLGGDLNAGTMLLDIPRPFPGAAEGLIYTPANPDGNFYGPINLRDAMGAGLVPSVAWVAQSKGINTVLNIAHQLGINSMESGLYDLSLLERGGEVSLLDMTYAYSVFAGLGQMPGVSVDPVGRGFRSRDPVAVLKIEDAEGKILWQYDLEQTGRNCTPLNCTPIFEPSLGYLVNNILSDQKTRWPVIGENNILDIPRPAAAVNGLTGDHRENWTIGYTPQIAAGLHLERADGLPLSLDVYGLQGAAPVWRALMDYVHTRDSLPPASWDRPDSIVEIAICERSGQAYNGICPRRTEIFLDGTQRLLRDDTYWRLVEVNSQTGQLATANTPAGLRSEQVFFVPPDEALDWWRANGLQLPPKEYDTVTLPDEFGATQILQPLQFDFVGGVVDIRGSMDAANMQYYQLSYGARLNPATWTVISDQQTTYTPGTSLGLWDTTGLDGLYTLRLTVVLQDNTIDARTVNVTVDNVPPRVTLTAGEPGQTFRWPDDQQIPLAAEVEDIKVDRVEFYHNGQFIGIDDEWPYGFNWEINRTGTEFFSVTAFDAVGNSASAEIQVEVLRAGS